MIRKRLFSNPGAFILLVAASALIGCKESATKSDTAPKSTEARSASGTETESAPAEQETSYKDGEGLLLSKDAEKAMNIQLVKVGTQNLTKNYTISVQVYRAAGEAAYSTTQEKAGFAYATTNLAPELIRDLKVGERLKVESNPSASAVVDRIDKSLLDITGQPELIVRIEDPGKQLKIGQTLTLSAETGQVEGLAVPAAAVLSNPEGSFVYRATGTSFLKTRVTLGTRDKDVVQVKEGLSQGDSVVTSPVNRLWLLELHFTKAGAD